MRNFVPLLPSSPLSGVVIDHSPAATGHYIGSPSIAILPGGEYLASRDEFGPSTCCDITHIFASTDRGHTWQARALLRGQYWSTLFVHSGQLYLIGTSREYGNCIIRKSTDAGRTWSTPDDAHSGLLRVGRYHCAPVPVTWHAGRLWRAMETYAGPTWGSFSALMLSADENADLLQAANWRATNALRPSPDWLGGRVGAILEGNAVPGPEGGLFNILRVHFLGWQEQVAVMNVSADGHTLDFDPQTGFVRLPGGSKKFTIRWDAPSGRYWALLTPAPDTPPAPHLRPDQVRNCLALASSADLKEWRFHRILLEHPDIEKVGFQYADWLVDKEDIIAVVRIAFPESGGTPAHNAHDANWLAFHRIENFRIL